MKLSERVNKLREFVCMAGSATGVEQLALDLAEHAALLEAKLAAIECGDCGLTMLECKCDDLEDG